MTTAAVCALENIRAELKQKDRVLVAIDGPCASGKTTLAKELSELLQCPVVHADHFFLRPEQRTAARLAEPGGNMDRERLSEVLLPLREGKEARYRPFLCSHQYLGEPILILPAPVILVEGSYSCHPDLEGLYDLRIFLCIESREQMKRLAQRESPESLERFRERWIPLENRYFSEYGIKNRAHLIL